LKGGLNHDCAYHAKGEMKWWQRILFINERYINV